MKAKCLPTGSRVPISWETRQMSYLSVHQEKSVAVRDNASKKSLAPDYVHIGGH